MGKITHRIGIHPKSVERFKDKIRNILRKNTPITMEESMRTLTLSFRGWINYYGLAYCKYTVEGIAKWARRKTRVKILKQWKCTYRRGRNVLNLYRSGEQKYVMSFRLMWKSIKYDGIWEMSVNSEVHKLDFDSFTV